MAVLWSRVTYENYMQKGLMEELTVSSVRGTVICCAIWILFSAMVGGN